MKYKLVLVRFMKNKIVLVRFFFKYSPNAPIIYWVDVEDIQIIFLKCNVELSHSGIRYHRKYSETREVTVPFVEGLIRKLLDLGELISAQKIICKRQLLTNWKSLQYLMETV